MNDGFMSYEQQVEMVAMLMAMRNCQNCTHGPVPCRKCYGSEPEETRCNPRNGDEFYMAQWEMVKIK